MKNSFAYYVAGIFDGEGCVDKKALIITNTHKHLIDVVALYLTKLGISYKVSHHPPQKTNNLKFYRIKIYGKKNLDNFFTYIPFIHRDKRYRLLKELVSYKPRKVTESVYHNILKLRKQQVSLRNIANQLNLGLGTITYFLHKGKY
jgi:intein/homing endonuclease